MTMTANLHDMFSATAKEEGNVSWLTLEDRKGNTVTIFAKPHVARAMADAFKDATQKEAAE